MKQTKLLLPSLTLVLLAACEKQPIVESSIKESETETITIKSESYPKDSIYLQFSKCVGMDTSQFYFDQEEEVFKFNRYDGFINPETYLLLRTK